MTHLSIRATVSALLALATAQVMAQETSSGSQGADVKEVTVTGSRIQQVSGMSTPTPVTAISVDDLKVMAPTTLAEGLAQLPQFLNNDTPQTQSFGSSGAAGASYVNLRGIGANRTLTLLDGRRVVPSTRSGSVDVALLPDSLVKRVDVVTGGASAAYGSDAVSGVVNFVLDSTYTGLKMNLQGGVSEIGDNVNYDAELTWGRALGERGHLVASVKYYQADGIQGYRDRDWFNSCGLIANPNTTGNAPRQVHACNVHATSYTYGGLITTGPLAGTQFLPGGATAPFIRGDLYTPNGTQVGGSGVDPGADMVWIEPDQKRGTAFAHYSYDFTDSMQGFAQVLYGYSDNRFVKDPANQWGPWEATIYADNAFLPQSIRDQIQPGDSFGFGRLASDADLGGGNVDNESQMISATMGLKGDAAGWNYNAYYQYGHNNAVLTYTNTARLDRLYRATDAVTSPTTGQPICRSTLSFPDDGCVPINLFGEGTPSREAINYINGDSSDQDQTIVQHFAELVLNRQLFELPAGRVSLATGGAYRKETLDNRVHRYPSSLDGLTVPPAESQGYQGLPSSYANEDNIFERTAAQPLVGSYNVWEAFGEVLFPLLADKPFAQRLDASTAVRYMNYSGSGGIVAWKGGIDWQIIDQLRFRATRSRDVRAGTLSERFDYSGTGSNVRDPLRPDLPAYAITAIRAGNPDVDPEKADTTTFGFVYQPAWLDGLSVSLDYYDIKIADAISSLGAQNIVDQCNDGAAALCDLITRNTDTGLIASVNNTYLNVAESRTNGVDFESAYRQPIELFGGGESIAVRALATFTNELSSTNAGASKVDRVAQTGVFGGAPKWQGNLALSYLRGPFQLTVQERYIGRGVYNSTYTSLDIDDNTVSSSLYTNLRASYGFASGDSDIEVYGNVTNLFDRPPPLASSWGFAGSATTNEGLFDVLGRRYSLGVRMNF